MASYNETVLDVIEREQEISELFNKIVKSADEKVDFTISSDGDLSFATEYNGKDVQGTVSKKSVFLEYANIKKPEIYELGDIVNRLIRAEVIDKIKSSL